MEKKTHQWLPSAGVREQSWWQMGTREVSGDGTVSYFGCAGAYMTIRIYQTENCTQRINFTICKLYQ